MDFLTLLLKGFIVGIAKIILGVSGALIAISFGIYEKSIKAISEFFKNPITNFLYLFPIGLGVLLSISLTSGLILYFILLSKHIINISTKIILFLKKLILKPIIKLLKKLYFLAKNLTNFNK